MRALFLNNIFKKFFDKDLRNLKIDFFIAGVQKSGTTALHDKLSKHPDIFLSKKKEIHFFDAEDIDWEKNNYSIFHEHFKEARKRDIKGEATPIYIYWPESLKRIKNYNPDAKIIVLLRHPTYRAISHWKMERTRGSEPLDFSQAISQEGRNRIVSKTSISNRIFSYVERGLYASQIKNLLEIFPKKNVFFLKNEFLLNKEDESMKKIQIFLGVKYKKIITDQKIIRPLKNLEKHNCFSECISYLNDFYRDDIMETAKLTDLDLSDWVDGDYEEVISST